MASVLVDFWEFCKRHRKALRRMALAAAVLVVLAAAVFVRISESPRFCWSCHIMRPYYEAWEESSHHDVNCLECHYPPTVGGHISSKFRAISQVVQYFTGSYGTRLWAEIDDEACLREGCHDTRLLSGQVTYKENIVFDHTFHLGDLRRGKKLRCTSCHSQIVVGTHIEVTESVCFTCHFKDAVLGKGTADCLTCHGPPGKTVTYKGLKFDHATYLQREVPCTKCHLHVVEGDGAVPEERCYSCHGDRSGAVTDPVLLHRTHVTDRKVECYECHLEIRHGTLELSPLLAPECATCHGERHAVQEGIYVGAGGLDTAGVPSAMFEAQVSCAGCHTAGVAAGAGAFPAATAEACVSCHGVAFGRMYEKWRGETKRRYEKARAVVATAKASVYATGARDPSRASARTLIAQAEKNLDLVGADGSYGAHNVIYTNALIETAVLKADRAAALVGRAGRVDASRFHVPPEKDTCAWRCHFGVERLPLTVRGKTFDHGRHLQQEGVTCTACHDAERHGVTSPTAYNCSACHHSSDGAECASCHGDASHLQVRYHDRAFDHAGHILRSKLPCSGCHATENPAAVRVDCMGCHHKDTGKSCASCHAVAAGMLAGTGAPGGPGKASPMANVACVDCHGRPPAVPAEGGCLDCHNAGYAKIYGVWRKGVEGNYRKLSIKVKEVREAGLRLDAVTVEGRTGRELIEQAEADLRWVGADGSWGAHNNSYPNAVLQQDLKALESLLAEPGE